MGTMRARHPWAGGASLSIVPQPGGQIQLKVWTVLGMESREPFRKLSLPAGPWRERVGGQHPAGHDKEVPVGSVRTAREAPGT